MEWAGGVKGQAAKERGVDAMNDVSDVATVSRMTGPSASLVVSWLMAAMVVALCVALR